MASYICCYKDSYHLFSTYFLILSISLSLSLFPSLSFPPSLSLPLPLPLTVLSLFLSPSNLLSLSLSLPLTLFFSSISLSLSLSLSLSFQAIVKLSQLGHSAMYCVGGIGLQFSWMAYLGPVTSVNCMSRPWLLGETNDSINYCILIIIVITQIVLYCSVMCYAELF